MGTANICWKISQLTGLIQAWGLLVLYRFVTMYVYVNWAVECWALWGDPKRDVCRTLCYTQWAMYGSQTRATTQELSWQAEADPCTIGVTHTAHWSCTPCAQQERWLNHFHHYTVQNYTGNISLICYRWCQDFHTGGLRCTSIYIYFDPFKQHYGNSLVNENKDCTWYNLLSASMCAYIECPALIVVSGAQSNHSSIKWTPDLSTKWNFVLCQAVGCFMPSYVRLTVPSQWQQIASPAFLIFLIINVLRKTECNRACSLGVIMYRVWMYSRCTEHA